MQQEDRTWKEKRRSCGIAERDREPWLLSDPCDSRSSEGRRMRRRMMMMMMIMATIMMVT
jgi:predicted nucleic acid-binding Zn ribbon protein